MAESDLHQALLHWNDHWRSGRVSSLIQKSPHRRRAFIPQRERIRQLPFQVLAGPRQVGKTTLVGHLMQDLMDHGVAREHVFYVPLDVPRIAAETDGRVDHAIRAYERYVLKGPLARVASPVHLFLDEIHTVENWAAQLKALYDEYHPVLRVLATGSSGAALTNPEGADLPGRAERTLIYPLKFAEMLEVLQPDVMSRSDGELAAAARAAREAVGALDGTPDASATLRRALDRLHVAAAPHEAPIRAAFDRLLVRGGYPAAVVADDDSDAFRFHQTTIDTLLSKDLKLFPKIRKPGAFYSFLALLARDHGGKFNANRYAQDLHVDKESPAHWKAVAEDVFVAHQLPHLNDSLRRVPRKADKAYIQDPGLRAFLAVRTDLADLERTGEIGRVVESVLFDHLRRLQFNLFHHRRATIGFRAKPEIDFVVQLPKGWLFLESKYRQAGGTGGKAVLDAANQHPGALAAVVTRNDFGVDPGAEVRIPAWMLALLA